MFNPFWLIGGGLVLGATRFLAPVIKAMVVIRIAKP